MDVMFDIEVFCEPFQRQRYSTPTRPPDHILTMWARTQLDQWNEEARRKEKEAGNKDRDPDDIDKIDENKQDSKQSTAFTSSMDSQLWVLQKMQTKQQLSGVMNSVTATFDNRLKKK